MLYAFVRRFDVTRTVQTFLETKQGQNALAQLGEVDAAKMQRGLGYRDIWMSNLAMLD